MSTRQYKITIKGRSYDVEVGDVASSPVKVVVDGVEYAVEVPPDTLVAGATASHADAPRPAQPQPEPPRSAPVPPAAKPPVAAKSSTPPPQPPSEKAGAGTIRAVMPGRVLRVNVAAGATVSRGQALIVLESMKMEQTIAAPKDGNVKGVYVAAGDAVTRGQTLVEIE